MTDTPADKTPPGRLRALTNWLRGGAPPATPVPIESPPPRPSPAGERLPERFGHYKITGKLGEGGMGVVYSARDDRLERVVALKTMSSLGGDELARRRFWREARAAASVNHPNVCQLYEIGEDQGELFIAMELLQGESLAERLRRGPFGVAELLPVGFDILAALAALHARGVVHRDLKPSNVFLTPHGVKLLDFGLARTGDPDLTRSLDSHDDLTAAGIVVGTPRYMSPEQAAGEAAGPPADLFATGAILFEMLAGRPAFMGRGVLEILHATLHEQPPALTGSPAIAAVDRVIRHALAKRPAERPSSAEAMADELRAVRGSSGNDTAAVAHALTRIVVLPFRVLRPDAETDFLGFSLPDAIATSLSAFGSLVVRSSAVAARFAGATPDLKALAAEADVDRVVMGTLLRAGDQIQATAQLVEAPAGTLLGSHTALASLGDLFRLQDDLARRVVEALALPLAEGGATPTPDAPRQPQAYRLYLEANQVARSYARITEARDLYKRCVELDPSFAPAWARLGRCYWVIGKYIDDTGDTATLAEQAYRRALDLSPRFGLAHKFYANVESDRGNAVGAMMRLLGEATRHGNDPELFAGLVHACRYCGLNQQSLAAHREARRLDPNVPTGYEQTVLMTCDFEQLLTLDARKEDGGADGVIKIVGLGLSGRLDEARAVLANLPVTRRIAAFHAWTAFLRGWLDRSPEAMVGGRSSLQGLRIMEDPEAIFQEAWMYSDAGDGERGLRLIGEAVAKGYYPKQTLETSRSFDALRGEPEFQALLARATEGRERALATFREYGGERLLGV